MNNPGESAKTGQSYVRYTQDLERRSPDEDELIGKIVKVLHWNNKFALRKYKHAIRDAHAKSHGILSGELTVYKILTRTCARDSSRRRQHTRSLLGSPAHRVRFAVTSSVASMASASKYLA